MKLLENKCGLITGGTSGIGREAAVLFARHGARVVVSGRRENEGLKTVELVNAAGGEAFFYRCDVQVESQVKDLVDFTVQKFGRLDFAFNNSGVIPNENGLIHQTSTEDFMRVMEINVNGLYYSIKYEAPYMIENGGGAIVNTCSINSVCCVSNGVAYGTSKFAAYGLTQCAALDYAKLGIRVNAVGPGPTKTPMIMRTAELNPETIKYLESTIPDGRMGEEDEPAKAALFLLSDLATHITGQLILVDGGQSVKM